MKKEDWVNDPEKVKEHIADFLRPFNLHERELFTSMVDNLIKLDRYDFEPMDLRLIDTSIDEFKRAFKVFQKYRDTRKICIFGSAQTKPGEANYTLAEEISKKITKKGYMVITGAGPGIMEAGNKGAVEGRHFGLNIVLPFEQDANEFIKDSQKLVSFKYFFSRKLTFIKESDGTILFPGGFGTQDEAFEMMTLIQTGRCSPRPMIMVSHNECTYWDNWNDYVKKELLKGKYIHPDDIYIYRIAHNVDQAVQYIDDFYSVYHSVRYLDNISIMRLNRALTDAELNDLNKEFSYILTEGKFEQIAGSDFPEDIANYPNLTKLIFKFNKTSYGALSRLIWSLPK